MFDKVQMIEVDGMAAALQVHFLNIKANNPSFKLSNIKFRLKLKSSSYVRGKRTPTYAKRCHLLVLRATLLHE